MREAPAIVLSKSLIAAGATVIAHDPEAMEESKEHYLGDTIENMPTIQWWLWKALTPLF